MSTWPAASLAMLIRASIVLLSSSAWNKMMLLRESSIPVIKGAILGRALFTRGKTCCPSIYFCRPGAVAARVA
eukprot:14930429-Heterocapsa_arctica.AAC.1